MAPSPTADQWQNQNDEAAANLPAPLGRSKERLPDPRPTGFGLDPWEKAVAGSGPAPLVASRCPGKAGPRAQANRTLRPALLRLLGLHPRSPTRGGSSAPGKGPRASSPERSRPGAHKAGLGRASPNPAKCCRGQPGRADFGRAWQGRPNMAESDRVEPSVAEESRVRPSGAATRRRFRGAPCRTQSTARASAKPVLGLQVSRQSCEVRL